MTRAAPRSAAHASRRMPTADAAGAASLPDLSAVMGPALGCRRRSPAGLGDLVTAVASSEQSWQQLVRFSRAQRWFRRLALTDDCEVWLLTWLPGQRTGFHDHGSSAGAFAVAAGSLRETLGSPGTRRIRHRTAAGGSVTRFGSSHLHDVVNVAREPAVSIHAYSPPLSQMRRYEMTGAGLVPVRIDRADTDW